MKINTDNYFKIQFKIFCLYCLVVVALSGFSKDDPVFTSIESFKEVEALLTSTDKNTLVVFDVDDTLIRPVDAALQNKNSSSNEMDSIRNELKNKYPILEYNLYSDYVSSIILKQAKRALIEPEVLNFIKQLRENQTKIIALTKCDSGSYGVIQSLPTWRYKRLKKLGIDFSDHYPEYIVFDQFPTYNGTKPVFYKGILFTNDQTKGDVLEAFLNKMNWKPSKVIFFDDVINYLSSVSSSMKKRKIPFQGFQYLGATKNTKSLDKCVAAFQFDYLNKYYKWLSDQEATQLIKEKKLCQKETSK